ncbi:MFS transporter [Limnohabitans radicicola]|uniref:MFS transporter n=1 Tax=Limnohabitans radicicola TaxID=2771427 RepID=A0A927FIR0_9BURK|nr:MFS transporter [Limnohabitans radicicola]MBD8050320.1 MFS transporter [Limnohabitans radicicola]
MKTHTPGLWLIGLAGFSSMASMRVCDPMLVSMAAEFQISVGDASRVISAFAVAYGLMQLFYGPLGDRVGKLKVITSAALACGVFSTITALAPSFDLLVLSRAAMGAAAAGIIPLSLAWLGDQVPYDQRQETLAKLMSATVTGMMAGQWFGGLAVETLGWRSAFGLLSALFLTASSLLYFKTTALRQAAMLTTEGSYWQAALGSLKLLTIPRVRWVLCVTAIEGALAFGTLAFVPSQLVQHMGLSASVAGGLMALYGIGGLAYSQQAKRWLGWLGERGLVVVGSSLVALGLLLLAWTHHIVLGGTGCLLAGLGFYMMHNTLQTQATQMVPEARGSAVTLFACMLFFGQSTGVLVAAQSVDRGWMDWTFTLAAAGMVVLGQVVSPRVKPKPRNE